jgi:nitrite reductase/ring-hydroxylating ferredoxin subunit
MIRNWKYLIYLQSFWLSLLFGSCEKERIVRNPYLTDLIFQTQINLNLPQYDNLRFAGGSMRIPQLGHQGVWVFNLNGTAYLAWEASCPNHLPNNCSQTKANGVLVNCSCENYQYSLATGQLLNPPENEDTFYPLLMYRVEARANSLFISN